MTNTLSKCIRAVLLSLHALIPFGCVVVDPVPVPSGGYGDATSDAAPVDGGVDGAADALRDGMPDALLDSMPDGTLDGMPDGMPDGAADATLDATPATPDAGPPPACADPAATLDTFYAEHGGPAAFGAHYRAALEAFLYAEADVCAGDPAAARARIADVWARYPIGDPIWYRADSAAHGTNVGNPVAYYALRMLDEVVDQALDRPTPPDPQTAVMTVALVGCSTGVEPRTWAELESGGGVEVQHALDPALLADDHALMRTSLELFGRYVFAMTRGHLRLELRFEWLPDVCVPVSADAGPYRRATIDSPAPALAALDAARGETDWWMVVYPSHVPEQHPDFEGVEFISGGMGLHPDGGPLFLADDRWFIRKPPHLGDGRYTEAERRAYLPQWLQHEFFHHLFRLYPEHALEAMSHQWFDRATWPDDFEGAMEPDYYAEALHRRMWQGDPPLHARLQYARGGRDWGAVEVADVLGTYVRAPEENGWHRGDVVVDGRGLRWRNAAGVSWSLVDAIDEGLLRGGADNPYFGDGQDVDFHLRLDGQAVTGFRFLGELYEKQAQP